MELSRRRYLSTEEHSESASDSSEDDTTWLCQGESDKRLLASNVLGRTVSRLKDKGLDVSNFHDSHKKFFRNLSLAASVGLWVTITGIPVYDKATHYITFGKRGDFLQSEYEEMVESFENVFQLNMSESDKEALKERFRSDRPACRHEMTGKIVNLREPGQKANLVPWNKSWGAWAPERHQHQIWCGWLSFTMEGCWPNVAQFVVFTVFASTGETVRLAWQGVIGTFFACLNRWFMAALYPDGAVGPAPYSALVCSLDVVLVLFLFLMSRANKNTIMFGMSWHVCMMMTFMNPDVGPRKGTAKYEVIPGVYLDDEVAIVMLTSLMGAVIAILATIVPRVLVGKRPLLNLKWITRDTIDTANAVGIIWNESIEYYCGQESSAICHKIDRKIRLLLQKIDGVQSETQAAWWETLNLGHCERARLMSQKLSARVANVHHAMTVLGDVLLQADFSERHITFCTSVQNEMHATEALSVELLKDAAQVLENGEISEDEMRSLKDKADELRDSQERLGAACHQAIGWAKTRDMGKELLFVFVLSSTARTVEEATRTLAGNTFSLEPARIASIVHDGLTAVTAWGSVSETEHVKFCVRNLVPICICFFIGYLTPEYSVFTPYSATMANTLALLVTETGGSAIQKNLHRVLGVMLGKFFPILIGAFLYLLPCDSVYRSIIHGSTLFLFILSATYVYYSSQTFGYMACLIAGFGVYPLMQPCKHDLEDDFASRYAELGEVNVAIMIQFVIDAGLNFTSPKQKAINKLDDITNCCRAVLDAFCEEDISRMQRSTGLLAKALEEAESLMTVSDPKNQLAPFFATPFRIELYEKVVHLYRRMLSDMYLLVLVCADSGHGDDTHPDAANDEENSSILSVLVLNSDIKRAVASIKGELECVGAALKTILEHDTETALEEKAFRDLMGRKIHSISKDHRDRMIASLPHRDRIYDGFLPKGISNQVTSGAGLNGDVHVRCTVAVHTLDMLHTRLAAIQAKIISEDVY